MKNIHILPTDKSSRLSIKDSVLILHRLQWRKGTQNIYITSDEEIKEGDCFLPQGHINPHKLKEYNKINGDLESYNGLCYDISKCKKIILTTDQDLIKDGVQAIDDEFLEWFVKNPSCEEVEVILNEVSYFIEDNIYKIIIPKEEPKTNLEKLPFPELVKEFAEYYKNIPLIEESKQETLEEFVFKVPHNYNIKPKEVIDMCMKEQENIILTWRLGHFVDMINSLPNDTEKNRILKSVFNNRQGELLLESYKSMKSHYEK